MVSGEGEKAAQRRWASAANDHLTAIRVAIERLQMVLVTDLDTPPEIADAVASEVVTVCAAVTGWLSGSQAPRGLRRAAAELGAGAGVYRNAAVAFRSLADADEDQRQVRSRAGVTLLEQGDHHVEVCSGILAKKLGE